METLYSTIYYSKCYIELNFDKSTQYVALLNSQKAPHTSPFRASYGVSFMSTSTEIDRVIKGFYCIITRSPKSHVSVLVLAKKSSLKARMATKIYPIFPENLETWKAFRFHYNYTQLDLGEMYRWSLFDTKFFYRNKRQENIFRLPSWVLFIFDIIANLNKMGVSALDWVFLILCARDVIHICFVDFIYREKPPNIARNQRISPNNSGQAAYPISLSNTKNATRTTSTNRIAKFIHAKSD